MMVVSNDQWRAEIGSFNCHRLYISKFMFSDVFKDQFYIFSTELQSFKH